MLFQVNPQASSTPQACPNVIVARQSVVNANAALNREHIAVSPHKLVPIPGVEIHINVNKSKKTTPEPKINDATLPTELTSCESRSVVPTTTPSQKPRHSAAPTTPQTPRHTNLKRLSVVPTTPSRPGTPSRPRPQSIKDKLLAELDLQCQAKRAKEAQALGVADPSIACEPLTHRAQRSLQFGSPKLSTVDHHRDIATQPQIAAEPNATITLNVVVDHQPNQYSTPATKQTCTTIGIEKLPRESVNSKQSVMYSKRDSNIEQQVFQAPLIPRGTTASQNNFQQSVTETSQVPSNEMDVDAFWLNFDDRIGTTPTEDRIEVCT